MAFSVLIVPDKFKGTMTALQAARAIAAGWRRVRPRDRLDLLPMSDGGDGFGDVLSRLLGARPRSQMTCDAAHRPCRARWWWAACDRTAVVESACVIGLAMLPAKRRKPFDLDTTGLGQLLLAVQARGARQCLVGIGGSATNDGGFGMASALGWQFVDRARQPIHRWPDLHRLDRMIPPRPAPLHGLQVTVAVDVQNPLLGPHGATRVYGPQKGLLHHDDLSGAERALRQLARVGQKQFGWEHSTHPGAGAAGGLGFGLMAFVGARAIAGSELFASEARLDRRIQEADLVVTGEGSIDRSSLMGKGVGDIAQRCQRHNTPCIALGGVVKDRSVLHSGFSAVHGLTPELTTPRQAMSRAAHWLNVLAGRVATNWPQH
jgi:glycerate 2-kinase